MAKVELTYEIDERGRTRSKLIIDGVDVSLQVAPTVTVTTEANSLPRVHVAFIATELVVNLSDAIVETS